ncbi:tubby C-terminal-like domain-containing protein [Corynascus novoguineensis]|uniref:Tubby C-terminal-like domain-containing protein n=1 Tax=Corynascus novoguineensis TaxID=1126955 RepID=A0AAN7CU03_9PEZI|nr:tubby C-terminal-like domain-containing protein [Corynascus novoguineensis]
MAASYALPPLPRALTVFNHMLAQQPLTLVLKEKAFDDFDIKGLDGARWMHIEGKIASLHGRKKVFDHQGNHLFDIIKEHFHLHATFVCEDANQRQYMQVKSKFKLLGSEANATYTTATGHPVTLTMKGDWFDTSADIVDASSGAIVARIDRQFFNARELLLGHQTYHVTIAPGADIALVVAMCVCLDEKRNER